MIELLVLAFPLLLMAFMLIMERVEMPIRREADGNAVSSPSTGADQDRAEHGARRSRKGRLLPASMRAGHD